MWFYEKLYSDIKLGIKAKLIYKKKTAYQDIKIYSTPVLGKLLLLDGVIQTTEKDEFIYHEMMTHPVLMAHPNPQKVLIIGGGDGGILREVLKYSLKSAYLIEIDEEVIKASKKLLPSICGQAFNDKRAAIIIDDGEKFIRHTKEKFDIIIVDSSDPTGAAKVLFSKKFYQNIFSVLKENGMMIRQTGSTFFQSAELKNNYKLLAKIFPVVTVQIAAIPVYIGGLFSFVIGSKKINPETVSYRKILDRYNKLNLKTKYYNPQVHFAGLKLPNYLKG